MEQLTPLELDILRRVALTNREIAQELPPMSPATVKRRLSIIYRKLGLAPSTKGKRWGALVKALKHGYLSVEEIEMGPRRKVRHER